MATSSYKVKFMFPNYQGKSNTLDVSSETKIGDIKSKILIDHILQNNYTEREKIGKIRLFNLGMEMKEDQTLNDCKKTGNESEGYDIIIHVHVNPEQPKAVKQKVASDESKKDSVCSCAIF